uniref:UMA domain-containing protein n=1 Tax=Nothobranchius kadleci TaxID=1051664 RepID=A0A1A8EBI0_NOTKA
MLNFFGLRKDSKKSAAEKDVDGGFVVVGETAEERRRRMPPKSVTQPSTNVIVQPSKPSSPSPTQPSDEMLPAPVTHPAPGHGPPASQAAPTLPDLLGDVPFTLAPHVLALQAGFPVVPDVLMSRDMNSNLTSFHYDFTLENSVIHSS